MKTETAQAIRDLNEAPLTRGSHTLERVRYSVVEHFSDATKLAETQCFERFFTDVYNGIFIHAIQPRLKEAGIVMADAKEDIHLALGPAISVIRRARWSGITRFPFEIILTTCCAEVEFRDVVEPVFFYPLIFPVLVAGHFPCGWDGDPIPSGWVPRGPQDMPKGRLMVHLIDPETT